MSKRDECLQALCRSYLRKLRHIASKHGLGSFVDGIIKANRRRECEGTRKEVEMLARMVDEERIERSDIPEALGKSYRKCIEDGDFDRVKKLKRVGIYSKLSVLLYKNQKK